ncbi:hypothetical protein, unlikely [Trypanosoma brucei brucei TREU927]|uniref:Uncharacterized protein n=1 Tax=Trypanosoma brucei brucei (strain 927/4 GUTat10.1) TaxID=185431 RepID=Q4GY68_TRYB2|nr:hypothetical protein, unlikely [Trypanosoma brucei brucei TREU927]CAJ16719.1 hypothetical protein, unlikely [Trypanosoma brucei brucei TREU927]
MHVRTFLYLLANAFACMSVFLCARARFPHKFILPFRCCIFMGKTAQLRAGNVIIS